MEFINILTIITLFAYLNIGPARAFFQELNGNIAVLIASSVLIVNYTYFRLKRRSGETRTSVGARLHWIASVYMVSSVAIAIYVSTLVSTFKR